MFNKKYRQRKIQDMIGSLNVRTSLTTLLENKKLPNAIILSGDNGIGKTSMAYSIAYELRCGCGSPVCEICNEAIEQLWEYREKSLTGIYEFDLGKNRDETYVDNVLDVFRFAGKKIIILDEIQNLSQMNMTKFLKSFEKLDEDTYIIICTTELYKLNTGITSRCEVFELTPPSTVELAAYLESICRAEGVNYARDGVYMIAKMKHRVRDAVNSLETIINISGEVHAETVRDYFGKSNYENAIEFLKASKQSSPYALLYLLQSIKESVGLYKFTSSLKEMLIDSVYARYGIKPLFMSEDDSNVLKKTISLFTTEELTEILKEVGRLQNRSNIDREIILINLGFALSNGSLMKKVGVTEEKKVRKQNEQKHMLGERDLSQQEHMGTVGFTLDTGGELGNSDEIDPQKVQIVDENEILNIVGNLFKGGVIVEDENED